MAETSPHSESDLSGLAGPDRAIGWVAHHPRLPVYSAVAVAAGLGWVYLTAMVLGARSDDAAVFGPGMALLEPVLGFELPPFLAALCQPLIDVGPTLVSGETFVIVLPMWLMMVLAMMLPSAAPMLATYAQIADTAARKGEPAAPVLVLASGYMVIWIGFSLVAALLQSGLTALGALTFAGTPVAPALAGAIFLAAALYQFTPAKHACLTKCQNPFSYFFARWTPHSGGLFRLGVEQGLFCLGCCWALMTVMFAVGVMNLVWTALLCILMTLEKTYPNIWITKGIGIFLLCVGIAVSGPSLASAFLTG